MKIKAYRLSFTSPVHFAGARKDYSSSEKWLHSDTLYSAIMDAWSHLGINITANPREMGFYLSSAFPYYKKDKISPPLYFFPRPYMHTNLKVKEENIKKLKKIKWYEQGFFEQIINTIPVTNPDNKLYNEFFTNEDGFDEKFILEEEQPKVKVGRQGKDSEPYFVQRIYFKPPSGLFFLVVFKDDKEELKLTQALNFLQDEGLGSYRTIGFGSFTFSSEEIELRIPEQSDFCCTLSLFCPPGRDYLNAIMPGSSYELLKRGGWMTEEGHRTLRKKSINMFAEGSIFNFKGITTPDYGNIKIAGSVHDVSPGKERFGITHPVYRFGLGFFIPVKQINSSSMTPKGESKFV